MMNGNKSFDPNWKVRFADMVASPQEAVGKIKPGQRVFVGTGCGQPQALVKALSARSRDLSDIEIVHLLTIGEAPYATKELCSSFRINSFFISDNVRGMIQEGLGSYTPIFLSDIPNLFTSGQLPLDVALVHASPPDENGLCSLGVSVDIVRSAIENASLVIAQVNPMMPRTLGNSLMHATYFDILVPVEEAIIEQIPPEIDSDTRKIAGYIAALVEDGCTVEFGIGRIPQAVVEFLKDKKDLGIHTEMFTDAIIDLVESGAVNGTLKKLDTGKISASFCMGTKRLYDYIDNNPLFSFHPTEYINDPFIISRQHRQIAINVALEIDLTGQVCADSLGSSFYSGIGGQVDFNRGAARSPGGKAIIALPSTAKDGTISRIVTRLSQGAGVVTTRGDVHYVATEHGVAYLHGKSVQERAIALIAIAHPSFREQLLKEAIEARYIHPEFAGLSGNQLMDPPQLRTSMTLDDGTLISFRSICPNDEPRMRDLFYALSQETIYYRYMSRMKHVSQKDLNDSVFINHRRDVAVVATIPEAYGDNIIAIGRYYLDDKTNMAEVAFVVHDDWQNRRIGSFLLRHLANVARRNGIRGFTAEVLRSNRPMQKVFNKCDLSVVSTPHDDVISYHIEFAG